MGRPRFLDALPAPRRQSLEPQLHALIARGDSIDRVLAWCEEQAIEVGRSTLAGYMREVKASSGGSAEDPALRVKREVLHPVLVPVKPRKPAPEDEPPAPPAPEEPFDHRALLMAQLEAAKQISTAAPDPKDRIQGAKLVLSLGRELRAVEASGAGGPQVVFYFPEKVALEQCEMEEA